MGIRYLSKKSTVESSLQLKISKLREWGYLKGYGTGKLTWSDGWGHESNISCQTDIRCGQPYVRLCYTFTNLREETRAYDYRICLRKTPCNLGGYRWWFICTLCMRKVASIMLSSQSPLFVCRTCQNLSYVSRQRYSRQFIAMGRLFDYEKKIERLSEQIKRYYYRRRPTKKYRKLLAIQAMYKRNSTFMLQEIQAALQPKR